MTLRMTQINEKEIQMGVFLELHIFRTNHSSQTTK